MKTNTRVRRNSPKKTAPSQVATSPESGPGKVPTFPSDIERWKCVQPRRVSEAVAKNYRGLLTITITGEGRELLGSFEAVPSLSAKLLFLASIDCPGDIAATLEGYLASLVYYEFGVHEIKGETVAELFRSVEAEYHLKVLADLKAVTVKHGALTTDQMKVRLHVAEQAAGELLRASNAEGLFTDKP